jgi:hypothetical protein
MRNANAMGSGIRDTPIILAWTTGFGFGSQTLGERLYAAIRRDCGGVLLLGERQHE